MTRPARPGRFDTTQRPGRFDSSYPPNLLRHNEVYIGPEDPYRDGQVPLSLYELWFDTTSDLFYARVDGRWKLINHPLYNEVYIGPNMPVSAGPHPAPTVALWGTLNGVKQKIAEDVYLGRTAPTGDQVVWLDTSTTPNTLRAKADGQWLPIGTGVSFRGVKERILEKFRTAPPTTSTTEESQ